MALVWNTCCSHRGPRFSSQHPHGSSQLSVTLVLGDLVYSLASVGKRHMHAVKMYTQRPNTHTHKNKEILKKKNWEWQFTERRLKYEGHQPNPTTVT